MFVFLVSVLIADYAAFSETCHRFVKISSIRGEAVEYNWDNGKNFSKESDK